MLDFDDSKNQGLTIFPQKQLPVLPRYEYIYKKIVEIIKHFGIEQNGPIKNVEMIHRKFSKKMREMFLDEIIELVQDLDISFNYTKQQNIEKIRKNFEKREPKEAWEFIKIFTETQPFVNLFDDKHQLKNNYAKLVAMKMKGKACTSVYYQARFNLNVTPSYSIDLLKRIEEETKEKKKPIVPPESKFSADTAVTGRPSNPIQAEDGILEFYIFLSDVLPNAQANLHTEHLIMEVTKEVGDKSEPAFLSFDSKNSPQFAIFKALYSTKYNGGVDKIMEVILHIILIGIYQSI